MLRTGKKIVAWREIQSRGSVCLCVCEREGETESEELLLVVLFKSDLVTAGIWCKASVHHQNFYVLCFMLLEKTDKNKLPLIIN